MRVEEYEVEGAYDPYNAIVVGLCLITAALILLSVIWAAFLAREFVHAKIENDRSIARSTERIADTLDGACPALGIYSTRRDNSRKTKAIQACVALNGAEACAAAEKP